MAKSEQAERLLASFPASDPLSAPALALSQALHTAPTRPLKSPRTAGILAGIVPGAGHLYVGKPGQAISAFLLNSLFLAGAAYAFHEGLEAVGAILLYFETGWYLGNIRSAAMEHMPSTDSSSRPKTTVSERHTRRRC